MAGSAVDNEVTRVRRSLVQSGLMFWERAKRNDDEPFSDAAISARMAQAYSYTLAAVLGEAAHCYGEPVANHLAELASYMLSNGDFDDINDDVMPEHTRCRLTAGRDCAVSVSAAFDRSSLASYEEVIGVLEALPVLIRETRRRKGQAMREAAEDAGVAFTNFTRWERGTSEPSLTNVVRVLRWVAR
jgi:DNA-binding XRE family transcriptional regulator